VRSSGYAFGGNPLVADAQLRGIEVGRIAAGGESFLRVGFYRRLGDAGLRFRLQESPDLGFWNDLDLPQQTIGTPQDMGDGTEFVNVRGILSAAGVNAEPRGFLRVIVERP
jgi:hypothetical protein